MVRRQMSVQLRTAQRIDVWCSAFACAHSVSLPNPPSVTAILPGGRGSRIHAALSPLSVGSAPSGLVATPAHEDMIA